MRIAAFLRAINVGGRRVRNDELVAAARGAGVDDVTAHLASGNLLLDAGDHPVDDVERRLETALADALGYEVEAMVRTADELSDVVSAAPWTDEQLAAAVSKPHVVFLRRPPDDAGAVAALSTDADLVRPVGRHVHWLPVSGMRATTFDPQALRGLIGPATARGLTTVHRVQERLTA